MPLPMFQKKEFQPRPSIKHVIAIAAGKGGVGKSLVTINLALALHQMGYKVGVLDADLYGPSVRQMLPEDRLPSQNGSKIIPAMCHGIRMISLAYFRRNHEAAAVRAPIANGLITQFVHQVEWGDLDYLLIDFPPGTGDIQLTLSQQANLSGAIMVTTPQEVAVLDVRKAMNLFDQLKVPLIGLIENMSYYAHHQTGEQIFLFGKGGGERLAQERGIPLLGAIPVDPVLCRYADQGKSIFEGGSETQFIADHFIEVAKKAIAHLDLIKAQNSNSLDHFEVNWSQTT